MKKESTSRRKKLPLLLGALLIISVAAYGTRAYFSDSTKQQANIVLDLGNVKVSTDENSWASTTIGENELVTNGKDTNGNYSFENVKPGDSFTKKFSIENTGSLKAHIELNYSGNLISSDKFNELKKDNPNIILNGIPVPETPFLISIDGLNTKFTLGEGETEDYIVTIAVDSSANSEKFNANSTNNVDLEKIASTFINETIIINATQANK